MTAIPAEPEKLLIFFNLSFFAYSEKYSSFLGTIYPSILNFLNFFLKIFNFIFNHLILF